jgi:CheY-like chemotaxis protein
VASTILLCEDNPVLRALVREILAGRDLAIHEAVTGQESIDLARTVRPDMIILDVVMPDCSGLEVLEELRTDPLLAGTPVLICTGVTDSLDVEAAVLLGADRYLQKPFQAAELVSAVDDLLAA